MAVIMTDTPADLRQTQRDAIASAAERQSEREARMRQEAVKAIQLSAEYIKTIHAYCDICDAEYHASKELLRRMGWTFGPGYEICPNHD